MKIEVSTTKTLVFDSNDYFDTDDEFSFEDFKEVVLDVLYDDTYELIGILDFKEI